MMLTTVLNILTTIAVLFGAYIAWSGLDEWKKQKRGNTKYDLARRVLVKTFKLRDAINQARDPNRPIAEYDIDNLKYENLEYPEFVNRIEKIGKCLSELYVEIIETEAIYGVHASKIFDNLIKYKEELIYAISTYFTLKNDKFRHGLDDYSERVDSNNKIVFRQVNGTDEFARKVDESISEIENFFRPKLKL